MGCVLKITWQLGDTYNSLRNGHELFGNSNIIYHDRQKDWKNMTVTAMNSGEENIGIYILHFQSSQNENKGKSFYLLEKNTFVSCFLKPKNNLVSVGEEKNFVRIGPWELN